jgi:hypothetical protein
MHLLLSILWVALLLLMLEPCFNGLLMLISWLEESRIFFMRNVVVVVVVAAAAAVVVVLSL